MKSYNDNIDNEEGAVHIDSDEYYSSESMCIALFFNAWIHLISLMVVIIKYRRQIQCSYRYTCSGNMGLERHCSDKHTVLHIYHAVDFHILQKGSLINCIILRLDDYCFLAK